MAVVHSGYGYPELISIGRSDIANSTSAFSRFLLQIRALHPQENLILATTCTLNNNIQNKIESFLPASQFKVIFIQSSCPNYYNIGAIDKCMAFSKKEKAAVHTAIEGIKQVYLNFNSLIN